MWKKKKNADYADFQYTFPFNTLFPDVKSSAEFPIKKKKKHNNPVAIFVYVVTISPQNK